MRLIYLLYFLWKADYKKVWQSIQCQKQNHNPWRMAFDAVYCSLYYGTSLIDYFNFRFFEKNKETREQFASMLFMYKFHKAMNDPGLIEEVDNKINFAKNFRGLAGPSSVFSIDSKEDIDRFLKWVIDEGRDGFVVKDPLGSTGTGVTFAEYVSDHQHFIVDGAVYEKEGFLQRFAAKGLLYAEPRLRPHPDLAQFAPWSLNSVRVITIVTKDLKVDIVAAVFRASVGTKVDNFSSGNIAAPVNVETGEVTGPARKKLSACSPLYDTHPKTMVAIKGFRIPLWDDVILTAKKAAMVFPAVRTVGWDIAILKDKVVILEGNTKWNKDTAQIPGDAGLKKQLQQYL